MTRPPPHALSHALSHALPRSSPHVLPHPAVERSPSFRWSPSRLPMLRSPIPRPTTATPPIPPSPVSGESPAPIRPSNPGRRGGGGRVTPRPVLLRIALLLLTLGGVTMVPARVADAQGTRATTRPPAVKSPAARKPAARKPAARKPVARRAAAPKAPVLRATTPRTAPALASDLGATIGASTRSGQWGAMVISLTRGDTLYSLNAGESMQPASTMKLMTTALVLDRFGSDHRFRTTVLRDGPLTPDGTLHGNLILRGAGDPAFSGRYLQGGPSAAVDLLASLVGGAGVRRVTGQVIGDASAFESRLVPAGWKESYLHLAYAAPVSALSINENLVWVTFAPGGAGGAANVTFDPASSGVPLVNRVTTRAGSGSSVSVVQRRDGGLEARGWIGTRAGSRRLQMVISDPAPFTTGAFREALIRRGIQVSGGIALGATPSDAREVAAFPSPPLSKLVSTMNRESINHFAELLFRNAARGHDLTATGSATAGDEALRQFLATSVGAPANAVVAADGSGLSLMDRVTARVMTRMLAYAHEAPWSSVFHASLPVAGESELLRTRMRLSPAQGNLHAKTGTTDDVIALAGYTTADNGEVIAFTFIYNGRDRWNAREAIDRMGETLSGFARPAPDVAGVAP